MAKPSCHIQGYPGKGSRWFFGQGVEVFSRTEYFIDDPLEDIVIPETLHVAPIARFSLGLQVSLNNMDNDLIHSVDSFDIQARDWRIDPVVADFPLAVVNDRFQCG